MNQRVGLTLSRRLLAALRNRQEPAIKPIEVCPGSLPISGERDKKLEVTASRRNLLQLLDDPVHRRMWLLAKALEIHPFELALELARIAETFITEITSHETAVMPINRRLTRES